MIKPKNFFDDEQNEEENEEENKVEEEDFNFYTSEYGYYKLGYYVVKVYIKDIEV